VPLGFLGIPSLHDIVEAIANGFFGALADALVPGFLKHGTVATIQHLVALPDPAAWTHVGQLQGNMVFLAVMLLPVTLAVGTLRYWLLGFTGQTHPVTAVARCAWVTGVLVAYRWIVEQAVAATNTLTHAILGLPTVGDGLRRIIGVLFGGALLSGAGGVFGAFLVIIGVIFAAGLFAAQVLLTVVLALLIVAGPPLIAVSAIPELSHLARAWAHALLATVLVPLGWTVLFATAGALCLDATDFTAGAGGLPGHVAAAFAGLITFVLAVKLPLMLFGELRHLLGPGNLGRHGSASPAGQTPLPGSERVRAAHARLRSVAFDGVPSLGRSMGLAAGAMGAPAGGPLGAARRGAARATRHARFPAGSAGARPSPAGSSAPGKAPRPPGRGVSGRLTRAAGIIRAAPREAAQAIAAGTRRSSRVPVNTADPRATGRHDGPAVRGPGAAPTAASGADRTPRPSPSRPQPPSPRQQPPPPAGPGRATPAAPSRPIVSQPPPAARRKDRDDDDAQPRRRAASEARRKAAGQTKPQPWAAKPPSPGGEDERAPGGPRPRPQTPAPVRRKPRPRSGP
jgi:uncharacterized membrane protein